MAGADAPHVRVILLHTYILFYENACVNQKQLTPSKRLAARYTKYKIRKVKEIVQDINVYTKIQTSQYIQRGNCLIYVKGTELNQGYTKDIYFNVSHNEHESEMKPLYSKCNESTTLSTKTNTHGNTKHQN